MVGAQFAFLNSRFKIPAMYNEKNNRIKSGDLGSGPGLIVNKLYNAECITSYQKLQHTSTLCFYVHLLVLWFEDL